MCHPRLVPRALAMQGSVNREQSWVFRGVERGRDGLSVAQVPVSASGVPPSLLTGF